MSSEDECPIGGEQAYLRCTDGSQCGENERCCAFDHLAWCSVDCEMGGFGCLELSGCPPEVLGRPPRSCAPIESGLYSICQLD